VVEKHIVKSGKLMIPENFEPTAPVYDPTMGSRMMEQPLEHTNPQTAEFCELLGIENKFHASEEEREARRNAGPACRAEVGRRRRRWRQR
jgi:lariat debranching enzyme